MPMIAQSERSVMDPQMFIALLNSIAILGSKDGRTKEETLAYNAFLGHAAAISRYNRLVVEDAINQHLDYTHEHAGPATRRP